MGYVICGMGNKNHGKTTTIKALCKDIEATSNSFVEVLYEKGNLYKENNKEEDVLRAYQYNGLIIFVVSAGDNKKLVQDGYDKLNLKCDGIDCDIFVCALRRYSKETKHINKVIKDIAKENAHWIDWLKIKDWKKDNNKQENITALKKAFRYASEHLINKRNSRI